MVWPKEKLNTFFKKRKEGAPSRRRRLFPHGGSAWILDKPSEGAEGELAFFQIGPLSLLSSRTSCTPARGVPRPHVCADGINNMRRLGWLQRLENMSLKSLRSSLSSTADHLHTRGPAPLTCGSQRTQPTPPVSLPGSPDNNLLLPSILAQHAALHMGKKGLSQRLPHRSGLQGSPRTRSSTLQEKPRITREPGPRDSPPRPHQPSAHPPGCSQMRVHTETPVLARELSGDQQTKAAS